MNIFILDDNTITLNKTENIAQKCAKKLALTDYTVSTFDNSVDFFRAFNHIQAEAALYILDIDLQKGEKEGIEVAQVIKKQDPKAVIVFFSGYPSYMEMAIRSKTSAYTFISKGKGDAIIEEQILQSIEYSYKRFLELNSPPPIVINVDNQLTEFKYDDVIFFEHADKLTYLHTKKAQPLIFYSTLKNIGHQLTNFIRVNRSFLVNPRNIVDFNPNTKKLTFVNGQTCTVSKRNVNTVIDWLTEHKEYFTYFS